MDNVTEQDAVERPAAEEHRDSPFPDEPVRHVPIESHAVGDPGRASSRVVPVPDPANWDRRDTVLDGFTLLAGPKQPVVEVRAASVRGLAHRHYGRVRQDEYGFRRTRDGRYFVVAVADGVSAGTHSHLAANIAARQGVDRLARALETTEPDRIPWGGFLRFVAESVELKGRGLLARRKPGSAQPDVREVAELLATTVLYAVVDLVPVDGAHTVHLVSIGDTSAWVLRAGGRWEPQAAVKNEGAELYSGSVRALPLPPPSEPSVVRTTVVPGEALVLMTDGVGDPLGRGTGEVGRFFAEQWADAPASALEFAAQIGFARRSFDDDRTAVALWPVALP
ncbi:protein phosphatase 2C domain-containing protein [Actinosynnema pretiosum subsp. pretiosum]|uniref:Protein phosphatase 2C domain-containing protein n=1 Tax=Actinosynnema pretiosum subsp. pretiosum TaxID=103721 RepID=A0AA45R746_9PSEU|nr:hypothetical protein APASM_0913 [Actinosynnema pretiosum subsp. pretiosum]QUF07353.1 protein phosphatase 2C domain-containing protein [Actinosynnema pretiosum subsp. pretiosum]